MTLGEDDSQGRGGGATDADAEDEMLDRLDAGLPPRSDEEARARAPYERLRARVRDLPRAEPEPGWQDRARDRWRFAVAARRRRQVSAVIVAIAGVAAAAAVVLWLTRRGEPGPGTGGARIASIDGRVSAQAAGLGVWIRDRNDDTNDLRVRGSQSLGSTIVLAGHIVLGIEGSSGGSDDPAVGRAHDHLELRLYREGQLVARCPGAPGCRETDAALVLEYVVHETGAYLPVLIRGDKPIPAPNPAGLDVDVLTARNAGLTFARGESILVGP